MPSELSMEIANRILEARKNKGLTQGQVSEYLRVKETTYANWEKGRAEPSVDTIYALCTFYQESFDEWLGLIHKSDYQKKPPIRINVLGRVPAGVPVEAVEDIIDWEELDPREYDTNKSYFGLLVTGESMSPKYLDGDIVIIEQTEDADSGKDVIAYVNGHDATLKRLVKYGNGNVDLKPLNPAYQTMTFTPGEIETKPVRVIGIVKELRRKV